MVSDEGGDLLRVLYISGLGRSGSTLLDRLLGAMPGVCALGEVTGLSRILGSDDSMCSCGVACSRCEFWMAVGDRAFNGWRQADMDRFAYLRRTVPRIRRVPRMARPPLSGPLRDQLDEYVGYFTRIYSAAAEVSGARVIVDSSKFPAIGLCLRSAPSIDLRLVHLVRDPRGVAYSWTKQKLNPATNEGMARYRPVRTALQWNLQNLIACLPGSPPGRPGSAARRVHYEDLLSNPREGMRALAEFAGLDLSDGDLSYLSDDHADLGVTHNIGGNPMRFSVGRVPLRRDDAWRTIFPPRQRRLVSAICAPLLLSYGYPLR